MSRKTDLETGIRQSYLIIQQYEEIIRYSDRPEEKARSQRIIREQWRNIESYLSEYVRIVGSALASDIAEIASSQES